MWNRLPDSVVHAESTDTLKQLDKFWSNQEIIYNAEIQRTGSQSVIN